MSYKRSSMRKLSPSAIATALAVKAPPPAKEGATRYTPTEKRGAKIRGSKTVCPYCDLHFFSKKAKSRHIMAAREEPLHVGGRQAAAA